MLQPHVSQALCGPVCLRESISVLLYWLSQLSQFKKRKNNVSEAPEVHSPIERRVEAFLMMSPDQPTGYQANLTLLSIIVQSQQQCFTLNPSRVCNLLYVFLLLLCDDSLVNSVFFHSGNHFHFNPCIKY